MTETRPVPSMRPVGAPARVAVSVAAVLRSLFRPVPQLPCPGASTVPLGHVGAQAPIHGRSGHPVLHRDLPVTRAAGAQVAAAGKRGGVHAPRGRAQSRQVPGFDDRRASVSQLCPACSTRSLAPPSSSCCRSSAVCRRRSRRTPYGSRKSTALVGGCFAIRTRCFGKNSETSISTRCDEGYKPAELMGGLVETPSIATPRFFLITSRMLRRRCLRFGRQSGSTTVHGDDLAGAAPQA